MSKSALFSTLMAVATLLPLATYAQQPDIQFFRYRDARGINVFEAPFYDDTTQFDGLKIRIGGNFAQQFQMLNHSNSFDPNAANPTGQDLYPLAPGFNLATANLNFDVQLADGVRMALESYMSSRNHSEFWVKGGFIQFDKLPMLGNPKWFEEYLTVRIGHMQVNYGDQQFRRSDNGNAAYNPFVGNYIMDAFTTEIGGEVYYHNRNGLFGMVGLTAGNINGDVLDRNPGDTLEHYYKRYPSLYLKAGWDKQLTDDFRLRFSGSYMMNNNTPRNTLYGGDRAGSRYYLVMSPVTATAGSSSTSGRLNPGLNNQINAMMLNVFAKYKGLEFFGTFENSNGRAFPNGINPDAEGAKIEMRNVNQIAAEVIYRFLKNEQLFVGARYNTVNGAFSAQNLDADGNILNSGAERISVAAGWWMTRNLMLKAEYVNQTYNGFMETNILHEGGFNGVIFEAVVAF